MVWVSGDGGGQALAGLQLAHQGKALGGEANKISPPLVRVWDEGKEAKPWSAAAMLGP